MSSILPYFVERTPVPRCARKPPIVAQAIEQEEAGAGVALYKKELATEQTYFMSFIQEAGLENPFAAGRVKEIKATLEKVLG